nr:TMV resistance protein N-like [Ipomoea batatas]
MAHLFAHGMECCRSDASIHTGRVGDQIRHKGWVLLPLLVAAIGLAGHNAELCTAGLAMQLRDEGIGGLGGNVCGALKRGVDESQPDLGHGTGPGHGPSEADLAQLADEIILEAAMGHLEQIAEMVMNEDVGPGPGVAAGLDMEDHTPIKNASQLNGNAHNSVLRRRKKKGFNMSPTLQVVGLDFDYDSDSEQGEEKGLNEWIEGLKRKKGYEKEFCKMIDEAQQEVIACFDKALRKSGKPCVNWVHKATSYMLSKIEGYEKKKKIRVEPVKVGKWVDLLKEEVGMDLIMEALREIKSYMSVVYDCNQQVHVEDEKEMAKKACIILEEIINTSQKGAVLGPGTVLGRQLHGHIEFLGGKVLLGERSEPEQDIRLRWGLASDYDLFPEVVRISTERPACFDRQGEVDCRPTVRFSEAEWRRLAESDEGCTLVGRFVKERPPLETIRARIGAALRLEGGVHIGSLNRRSITLRFDLDSDFKRAWFRGQVMVDGAKAWFERWSPAWCATKDSPLSLVWVELPNLPLHLFDFESISRICAPFGRAIELDLATVRKSRPSVAKVRLEIDVTKPRLDRIWIEFVQGNGMVSGFWQRIEFLRIPVYCEVCGRFGHGSLICRRGKNDRRVNDLCRENPVAEGDALHNDALNLGMPTVCVNAPVTDTDGILKEVDKEAILEGLEELARKGISVDQFVGEAVFEAAVNIIEEAVGNVMKEDEVGEVNEGAQEPITALQAEGLEAELATPSPTLEGVKENGGGTRLKETVESDKRSIGSSSSMSFNTWAKGMKEKWGPECGKIIDEAKQEVLHFFEKALKDLGQSKYDEMEPQLLEKAEKWNQDEDLGDIIENSLGEIRAYLRNNHGGWLEKFDAKAASEASSILKCKIEASSIVKKYGPKSRLGWGLKCKHLSTGYFLCDWARKYFDGVIDSEGSGSSEESDEE